MSLSIGTGTWLLCTIANAVAIFVHELNRISDPFFKLRADTAKWSAVVPLEVVEAYLHPIYLANSISNFFIVEPKFPEISPLFSADNTDCLSFFVISGLNTGIIKFTKLITLFIIASKKF